MEQHDMAEQLRQLGYGVIPPQQFRIDFEENFRTIWNTISDYTMTSMERGYALFNAVKYISAANIKGAVVECGVWKGGSSMLAARTLLQEGEQNRQLYLYDTFTGMPAPSKEDKINHSGEPLYQRWEKTPNWWASGIEEVQENMKSTGYPQKHVHLIKGKVEQTLQKYVPDSIALLRLDTDWYESTRVELETLYPLLQAGGVLILDDYGHFTGAKKAVDDYFAHRQPVLLNRIDYTGRIGVKLP